MFSAKNATRSWWYKRGVHSSPLSLHQYIEYTHYLANYSVYLYINTFILRECQLPFSELAWNANSVSRILLMHKSARTCRTDKFSLWPTLTSSGWKSRLSIGRTWLHTSAKGQSIMRWSERFPKSPAFLLTREKGLPLPLGQTNKPANETAPLLAAH